MLVQQSVMAPPSLLDTIAVSTGIRFLNTDPISMKRAKTCATTSKISISEVNSSRSHSTLMAFLSTGVIGILVDASNPCFMISIKESKILQKHEKNSCQNVYRPYDNKHNI